MVGSRYVWTSVRERAIGAESEGSEGYINRIKTCGESLIPFPESIKCAGYFPSLCGSGTALLEMALWSTGPAALPMTLLGKMRDMAWHDRNNLFYKTVWYRDIGPRDTKTVESTKVVMTQACLVPVPSWGPC